MGGENFVPKHGNYRGYYTKRHALNDPRLALLPAGCLKGKRVLDVGCNEGWVTCEIAQLYGAREVVGADIDDALVRMAWKRRRTLWSQQKPSIGSPTPGPSFNKRKLEEESAKLQIQSPLDDPACQWHFPSAFEHMFGALPIPSATPETRHCFPHNIVFRTADWVTTGILEDKSGYDVILAFSVSKWIHLNGGDAGLLSFFQRVYDSLNPGGVFVLEPQEWEGYAKAKRMDTSLKENAAGLQVRPEKFSESLRDIGFSSAKHVGKTGKGGFHRPIDLYRKPLSR